MAQEIVTADGEVLETGLPTVHVEQSLAVSLALACSCGSSSQHPGLRQKGAIR